MRAFVFPILVCGSLPIGSMSAFAQDVPAPSFLERGLGGLIDPKAGSPSAYASPSAIPGDLVPSSADVGAPQMRPLQRFDPISLPEGPLDPVSPKINLPGLPAYAPQNIPPLDSLRSRDALVLEARLTLEGETVPDGLTWRLFSPIPALDGKLPLIASAKGGTASFEIERGSYLLHVGFGLAGVTKRINFTGVQTREVVVLEAGGLRLNAVAADDVAIPAETLRFDVYSDAEEERDRMLIADEIPANQVVRLNAGTYHVVSNYGTANAVIRADIRVDPGKLTEATIEHRAAQVTLKLVRELGGEAIADTAWSISTASGDVIRESVSAFPSVVLAEGEYLIVAKNKDRIYQREFQVRAGVNTDVEVLTADLVSPDPAESSGD